MGAGLDQILSALKAATQALSSINQTVKNSVLLGNVVTGTGPAIVLQNSPTLVTPNIGVATATSVNGVTINNNAWTAFTPSVSASSGTVTSTTPAGRFMTLGKTVFVEITITIINNGSGAGGLLVTLPSVANSFCVIAGRENASTGNMLQGIVFAGSATLAIFTYNNLYPAAAGYSIIMSGVYESV